MFVPPCFFFQIPGLFSLIGGAFVCMCVYTMHTHTHTLGDLIPTVSTVHMFYIAKI